MDVTSPPSDPPTCRDIIWNYRISEAEYEKREFRLRKAYGPKESWTTGFTLDSQLYAYSSLNNYEKELLSSFFKATEGKEYIVAFYFIDLLYKSDSLRDERKGLLALAVRHAAFADGPIASIVKHATPIDIIDDDDWAFYVALASIKLHNFQPFQARFFINLAKLVPHHHTALVSKMDRIIAQEEKNRMYKRYRHFSASRLTKPLWT